MQCLNVQGFWKNPKFTFVKFPDFFVLINVLNNKIY